MAMTPEQFLKVTEDPEWNKKRQELEQALVHAGIALAQHTSTVGVVLSNQATGLCVSVFDPNIFQIVQVGQVDMEVFSLGKSADKKDLH